MCGLADWLDAVSSAFDQTPAAEVFGTLIAAALKSDVNRTIQTVESAMMMLDLASAWLRSSAEYYRECGYY
jgi:hypothetical protein